MSPPISMEPFIIVSFPNYECEPVPQTTPGGQPYIGITPGWGAGARKASSGNRQARWSGLRLLPISQA